MPRGEEERSKLPAEPREEEISLTTNRPCCSVAAEAVGTGMGAEETRTGEGVEAAVKAEDGGGEDARGGEEGLELEEENEEIAEGAEEAGAAKGTLDGEVAEGAAGGELDPAAVCVVCVACCCWRTC